MKRTLCLFLALILAVGICFSAPVTITASATEAVTSGTCGATGNEENVTWSLVDGTLTISGTGAMADYDNNDMPWKNNKSAIKKVVIENGVTTIGEFAFYYCGFLTSVTIPKSVTSIGASAFEECSKLNSVEIPEGVITIGEKAFYLCSYLDYVKIPESVTSIGTAAFVISSIAKVKVPCKWHEEPLYEFSSEYNQITVTIADHAYKDGVCEACGYECPGHTYEFAICTNCSYVCHHETVTDGVCEVCGGTYCGKTESDTVVYFYNDSTKTLTISGEGEMADFTSTTTPWYSYRGEITTIVINKGVTSIGKYSFHYCSALTSVTIPESVTSIGSDAFQICTALPSVTIPESVTTIGNYAFGSCSELALISIPDSVTEIGESAFYRCTKLGTVEIGAGITKLSNQIFGNCTALKSVTIPNGVTTIGALAFYGCSELTSVTIPKSVTTIGENAFEGCTSLTTIEIPDSVTTIDSYAFKGCTKLGTVEIGAGITKLSYSIFAYCTALKSVTIPDGVTTIGAYAFAGCTSLTTIEIPDSVTTIETFAFNGCTSLTTIEIPDSVTTIDSFAFKGCTSLTTVTIPYSVTEIGSRAFEGCTSLTTVNVPCDWDKNTYAFGGGVEINYRHIYKNGKCIGDGCVISCSHETITDGVCTVCDGKHCGKTENDKVVWFYDEDTTILTITGSGDMAKFDSRDMLPPWANYRDSIKKVVISDGVTNIANYAFYNCTALKDITIGKNVATIDYSAFLGCSALESITVDENNASYLSEDGILFSKDKTKIIRYPQGKAGEYNIPKGVKTIGVYAFRDCALLTSVTIPEGVTTIEEFAFFKCTSISTITIPEGVTSVGNAAFVGCEKLETITLPYSLKEFGAFAFDVNADWISEVNVPCSWNDEVFYPDFKDGVLKIPPHEMENSVCKNCGNDCIHPEYKYGTCTTEGCGYACAHETMTDGVCVTCGGKHCGNTENDKVVWFYDEDTTILTITGSDDLAGYTFGGAPWEAHRESVRGIDIKDGVTSIGIGTFCGCDNLTSVIIPGSVKIIGDNAFSGCEKLSNVRISEGVISIGDDVFKECIALKEITIPESVTEIGEDAFCTCQNLMTITIPKNVTVIGEGAFGNCTRLTEINVDEGNTTYSSEDGVLFNEEKTELICCPAGKVGNYEVTSGVTSISNYAFSSRGEIFTVTIPVSVTTIGDFSFAGSEDVNLIVEPGSYAHEFATTNSIPYTFNGYTEAETDQIEKLLFTLNADSESYSVTFCDAHISGALKIPATYNGKPVTEIGNYAFANCISLTSVTIPDSVTTIGAGAFNSCFELISITIPESVTAIGSYAFDGCSQLASISVDDANTKYSSVDGVLFNKDKTELICYPTGQNAKSYTILDSVITIGEDAFRNCTELTSVTIPDSVTTIGESAFWGCSELTSVTIPESVTTIGGMAFYGCTLLETVIITGFNTAIGEQAFEFCTNVTLLVKEFSNAHAYASENNIKYITYVGGSGELGKLNFTPIRAVEGDDSSEITGYSVTARDTSISGALTIPTTYNGKPVTAIGDNAFSNCTSLTSVEIPGRVETIGEYAFKDCSENLLLLVKGGSALEIYAEEAEIVYISFKTDENSNNAEVVDCSNLITGSLTIPSEYSSYSVTAIDNSAFSECTGLTSVIIPKSVTTIGENAFANCDTLNSVEILGNVTEISARTFEYCMSLSSITIPESVTEIGENAFAYCETLSSIVIPESVTTIGDKAFSNCTSLQTATIEKGVKTIGEGAFADCSSLSSVIIPNSVTTIGKNAFDSCTNLESVTIGENVGKIDDGTFGNCTSLKTIKIPDSVKTIGAYAFKDCSSFKEIVIPESVETIGAEAFYKCGNLKYIFFEGTEDSQKTIGDALDTNAKIHYGSSTHTFNENYTVDTEPTCTEKGSESQHCKYCDLTQNERPVKENGHTSVKGGTEKAHTICDVCEEILSAEHEFASKITTEPTCTKEGVKTFTCECGYTYTKPVATLGHDKVSHSAKSATCEAIGWYAYDTCSRCDYTTYKEIAKLGHDIVIDEAVEATCTKTGLTEGSHCTRCDDKTVAQQTIAKKAHTEVTVTGKAATCTATGLTDGKKCSVCGTTTVAQQTIAKKGHKEVTVTGKAATCTEAGLTDGKKCSVCGTVTKAQETIKAKGHTTSVINKKDATCTVDGYTGDTYCSVCKTTTVKGTVVKAPGHKEVAIPAVAPTYTTVGKTEGKKCSVCGIVTVAQKDVAKLTLATPVVTAVANNSGIKVNWNNVENAQSYVLYKRVFDATANKWSKWKIVKTGLTGFEYIDSDVVLGTKYRYTVRAKNGDTLSPYKTTTTVKYNVTPTVKVANYSNGVKVTWTTVANATGYRVYRSTLSNGKWSNWKNMGTAKSNKTSWTDKSVKSNVTYKYTVRAVYNKVLSSYNKAGASVLFLSTPTVKIVNNANGIKVSWNKIAGATGYTVYSSTYDAKTKKWSSWKNRGTAKANKTSWVDKNVKSGVKYKYTVRAVNGKTKSAYVSSGDLLYLAQPAVTVKSVSNGINISWTKSSGATEYKIYRSEYNAKTKKWSSWKGIKSAKSTVKSYTDKTTKKGVKYKYTVRAINGKVKSSYKASNSISK